jgi:hypothetical protein
MVLRIILNGTRAEGIIRQRRKRKRKRKAVRV